MRNSTFSFRLKFFYIAFISICLLLVSMFYAQASTNLRSFGNSITRGQGLADSTKRFSCQLADYLNVFDLNGSISGMTLVNNNFYEDEAIKDGIYQTHLLHAASDPTDYALIMFGTNDLRMIDPWNQELNQVYVNQYREYLQLLVDSLLAIGFDSRKIFLLSDPYTQADEAGRDSIEAITEQVALKNNTLHLNTRKAIQNYGIGDYTWRGSYTDDSVHPNESGHEVLFQVIKNAYIEQTTNCPAYIITADITNETNAEANGSIIINIQNGSGSYTYNWSNGASTKDIDQLSSGNYTLTLTDENDCESIENFSVENIITGNFIPACEASYKIPVIKKPDEYARIVYINPDYSGPKTGSIEQPYSSWKDITPEENTAYLIRSGTILEGGIDITANNNYIGKYGDGPRPIVMNYVTIGGIGLVMDSLNIRSYGDSQYQKILSMGGVNNITIANSYITGLVGSYDYPYYLLKGTGEHITFYNNIMSGAKEDGLYVGSSPYFTFVRNWLFNTNMGGVDKPYGGDGIQFEYDNYIHAYIAGNIIDRHNTMSKFCLIINAEELTHDVVCEWNTFVAPKNGNGGAAVRWLGGANNKFNKNLIITYQQEDTLSHKVSGIATYDVSANQEYPYGIRDNHFYGLGNMFYGISNYDESNLGFVSEDDYYSFLAENEIGRYGSDIDTASFWTLCSSGKPANVNQIEFTDFDVFPNPTTSELNIKFNSANTTACKIQLMDQTGRVLLSRVFNNQSSETIHMDVSGLQAGHYFLQCENTLTGYTQAKAVLIQK